jgi:guanine deaminase
MSGAKVRAYRGRVLTPIDEGGLLHLDDGLLVVEAGRIVSVSPWPAPVPGGSGAEPAESAEPAKPPSWTGLVHDLRPLVLVPGFVDTHVHFPQTRVIGRAGAPLLEWLERTIFPEEARFASEPYARAVAAEFVAALAAAGTTTASIYSTSHEGATAVLFEALATSGLRAQAGLTLMDQACPDALRVPRGEALAACERLAARWHGQDEGRLGFVVTPRFALSCSRALMEDAARFATRNGLRVQTHVSEHPAEGTAVLAAHTFGPDYLGVYEAAGLLGSRTLLAHCIHLTSSEWDRIAAAGAKVAHCPDSNFFLGSGRMDLGAAHRRGVAVGLGSDVAAGRSFEIRTEMARAYDNALCLGQRVTVEGLFRMATLGGAEALGLAAVTGSLTAGKEADFLALDIPGQALGAAASAGEILAQVAFGDGVRVTRAFVRGRVVYDGGSASADSAGSAPKPPVNDGGSAGSAPKPPVLEETG